MRDQGKSDGSIYEDTSCAHCLRCLAEHHPLDIRSDACAHRLTTILELPNTISNGRTSS